MAIFKGEKIIISFSLKIVCNQPNQSHFKNPQILEWNATRFKHGTFVHLHYQFIPEIWSQEYCIPIAFINLRPHFLIKFGILSFTIYHILRIYFSTNQYIFVQIFSALSSFNISAAKSLQFHTFRAGSSNWHASRSARWSEFTLAGGRFFHSVCVLVQHSIASVFNRASPEMHQHSGMFTCTRMFIFIL